MRDVELRQAARRRMRLTAGNGQGGLWLARTDAGLGIPSGHRPQERWGRGGPMPKATVKG